MNILLWVIVTASIALVCFAIAKQTGFNVPSLPTNKWVRKGLVVTVAFAFVALLTPNFAQWVVTGSKGMVTTFDESFDSSKVSVAEKAPQQALAAPPLSEFSTDAIVVPIGATIAVVRPVGHYLASVNCPKEVVMEVIDSSTGALVQQQDCNATIRNGNLPLNIKLAFFQKGDDGEPVDVIVRWKKIS